MLNIALPKGRLGKTVYERFAAIGCGCPELEAENRRLVFVNEAAGVSYLQVKPSDVAIYVERGAADIGVVGSDILLETQPDIYELLDLGLGRCRLAVAAPDGWCEEMSLPLRVATKYPHVAQAYYAALNRQIDIIKLHGSIELAPLLGLSDVIVDIVETGTTLRENGLSVVAEIAPVSTRLIANRSSYQFNQERVAALIAGLEGKR